VEHRAFFICTKMCKRQKQTTIKLTEKVTKLTREQFARTSEKWGKDMRKRPASPFLSLITTREAHSRFKKSAVDATKHVRKRVCRECIIIQLTGSWVHTRSGQRHLDREKRGGEAPPPPAGGSCGINHFRR
jgi:hypothetical protein